MITLKVKHKEMIERGGVDKMDSKNLIKIGLTYFFVFIIAVGINMFNGYPFSAFWFPTLLSVAIYVTIVIGSMYLLRKLNTYIKLPLVYIIAFILSILTNVVQGYEYDMYIKSVIWGTVMFVTMTLGLYYIFQIKE